MSNLALILKNKGIIDDKEYQRLLTLSDTTGKSLEDILSQEAKIPPETLLKAKAQLYNVPYIDIDNLAFVPEALNKIPEAVAKHYLALPFAYDEKENLLSVALADPIDLQAIEFLEAKANAKIKPYLADPHQLRTAIAQRYSQSLSEEVSQVLQENQQFTSHKTLDSQNINQIIREAPIAKIVTTILEYAVKSRASDVHIEPLENKTRVRYRIDGILQEKLILPKKVHDAVISRIKILSGMKIDEKRLPQDGRFSFQTNNQEVDLRVSSLPTIHGEKIVMRLLRKTSHVPTLAELGLTGTALKNLSSAIHLPHGIILITGPTGSGKTTTLYSILHLLNTPGVNIVTLEDPVEYQIEGVNQVQINPQAGLTFANGLRSFLRQDPNIIMVGEIRDQETAELAIQAALTGHLVFATLHTNDAAGAIPRLIDMGAEPFLLASSLIAVVAQRVVRRICPYCQTTYNPDQTVINHIKMVLGPLFDIYTKNHSAPLTLVKGQKCSHCNNTGYLGRIGIFEVLMVNEKIGKLTMQHAAASEIQKVAINNGMILMQQDGYLKALQGITTIEEVDRVSKT